MTTPGEARGSDFIYLPNFTEYVMCQDFEQQLALIGFYRAFCKDRYEKGDSHLDGRQGKFPAVLGHIWTNDSTLYALNATENAFEDPSDYLFVAAQIRDDKVQVDELDVLRVRHVATDINSIDKVIDAGWQEAKKDVTVQLGKQRSVMTRDHHGIISYSPALTID